MNQYELNMSLFDQNEKYKSTLDDIAYEGYAAIDSGLLAVNHEDRWYYLNSRYDSVELAKEWAAGIENVKSEAVIIVFGFANGEYARELIKNYPDNLIIIYEPSIHSFKAVLSEIDISDILSNEKVFISVKGLNENIFTEALLTFCIYINIRLNIVTPLPMYDILFTEDYQRFLQRYKSIAEGEVMTRNTIFRFGKEQVLNSLKTIPDAIKQYSISQIRDCFKEIDIENVPAILVSAGPSLDKNIMELKNVNNRAFIIAVDTALKSVINAGITPDMTITIDPKKDIHLFQRDEVRSIPMVFGNSSNAEVLSISEGKKFYFDEPGNLLYSIYGDYNKKICFLETGGSVANSAFSFLNVVGFKNIILVGQDLAYPNNQRHAKAAYGENDIVNSTKKEDRYIWVKDINGNDVLTEINMNQYRLWFERQIERYDYLNVIDATEGGALINGTTVMTLHDAIEKYCDKAVEWKKIIDDISPVFSTEEQLAIKKDLLIMPERLDAAKKEIENGMRKYDRILELAQKNKYSTSEYKRLISEIGVLNAKIENDSLFSLVSFYAAKSEYEVRDDIYNYDESQSMYEQVKAIVKNGQKMFKAYSESIDEFKEALPVLLNKLKGCEAD